MKTLFIAGVFLWLVALSPASAKAQGPQGHQVQGYAAESATAEPPDVAPVTEAMAIPEIAPGDMPLPPGPEIPILPATPVKSSPLSPRNPNNDRIFMVIPNYATVEHPGADYQPITAKEKFKLGALDAFDPYSFPIAGVLAGIAQATNEDATWGQGLQGYGKRYAAGYADAISGSFMTTGVFPAILHEDPRYFRKGSGGFWPRTGYAIKRLLVIRTDSGGTTFNFSEFGGNATAGALSLTYHSAEERNFPNFVSGFYTQVTIDLVSNMLKEFWPDLRHKTLHR
jgi:hypothetical protein